MLILRLKIIFINDGSRSFNDGKGGILVIEINNLNVLYNNSIRALDNVSIKIEQQKCIAIVGENGSGKSTLLSSLLGLVETQGEIKINGVMLSKETLIQIREVAGLVFQNPDHMIFYLQFVII